MPLDSAYRVLARKYRPTSFADLIGQEALVRTLSNAFDLARIHQAYLLSGVRGVGKTTTARIMARALNYHRPARDGALAIDAPTIRMDDLGTHCQAIIESRHVDVIEMDAASHTGIDDIRELIEGARYRPVMARTKVYIIDEVHMLSKQAFNGLLKTLEEPPGHVKFLFATTEVDKVPVTVRSRCQRFDLRRVDAEVLVAHLASICAREAVEVEPEALALIARAAEGSVRDALSLLDQAIAHGAADGDPGAPKVAAASLRAMLGLADRARVIDLFEAVMGGGVADAMAGLKDMYDAGADPGHVVSDLAEFVHVVTRLKLVPGAAKDSALTEEERRRGADLAGRLSLPVLTRTWQLLVKGLADIKDAPRPLAAADMVLVRLACAADLPTPDEALRQLAALSGGAASGGAAAGGAAAERALVLPSQASPGSAPPARLGAIGQGRAERPSGAPVHALAKPLPAAAPAATRAALPLVELRRFEDVVALAGSRRDIVLKAALERDVRLVRFEPGTIEFELAPGGAPGLASDLMRRLAEWTGTRWMVALATAGGAPSLREQAQGAKAATREAIAADPLVRQVLETFPGSEIVAVRALGEREPTTPALEPAGGDDEVGYADEPPFDDDL